MRVFDCRIRRFLSQKNQDGALSLFSMVSWKSRLVRISVPVSTWVSYFRPSFHGSFKNPEYFLTIFKNSPQVTDYFLSIFIFTTKRIFRRKLIIVPFLSLWLDLRVLSIGHWGLPGNSYFCHQSLYMHRTRSNMSKHDEKHLAAIW